MSNDSLHRIRLAGPWELIWGENGSNRARIQLPSDASAIPDGAIGDVVYRRAFHAPTGLSANTSVWLEFPIKPVDVRLDEQPCLIDATSQRCDLTGRLSEFHMLAVSVRCPPGLTEPVWLVISEE